MIQITSESESFRSHRSKQSSTVLHNRQRIEARVRVASAEISDKLCARMSAKISIHGFGFSAYVGAGIGLYTRAVVDFRPTIDEFWKKSV